MDASAYCCGVYEVGSFSWRAGPTYYQSKTSWPQLPAEEVLSKFDQQLRRNLWDCIENYDETPAKGHYLVRMEVLENDPAFVAFMDHLKAKRWKLTDTFVNANTGNTVNLFQKKFKLSALHREFHEKDSW